MNKYLELTMTHRVDIHGKKMMGWLAPLMLALTLMVSSCSPATEGQEGNDAWVTLTISTGGEAAQAKASDAASRASGSAADKDWQVNDLTIYIFDQTGQVIGSSYASYSINSKQDITATVKTRKAQGCTVIALANAGTLSGTYATAQTTSPFAGVSTLSEFQQKYITFKDMASLESAPCLLMVGYLKGFDTTSSGSNISLQRLASRLDFTITVNQDKDTGRPIVVDSYQLCHAPLSAYYASADMSSTGITLPSGTSFVEYAANSTAFNSWTSGSNSQSYTAYVYANPATTATDATYLLIKAHSQASPTDTRKIWQSEFKVYLTGITGLADYQLLPNYHYTIGITVQGSATEHNGVKTVYTAYPYYSSSLSPWGSNENRDLDMK